jgi:hypothetical protein
MTITIDLSGGPRDLHELLRLAGENNLILRTADGKEFLLAEIDDFEREVALVRQNPELMELLEERSKPGPTLTLAEVRESLGLNEPGPGDDPAR